MIIFHLNLIVYVFLLFFLYMFFFLCLPMWLILLYLCLQIILLLYSGMPCNLSCKAIQHSRILYRDIVFIYALYIHIRIISIHEYRNCIHPMCAYTNPVQYQLLSILNPPPQYLSVTPTSPQHTIYTSLHAHHEYKLNIVK